MEAKKFLTDDDRGVSPVIGVILMVAITVILAAVIASFVLGLGDTDGPAPQPTINAEFSTDELEFGVSGGDDFDSSVATLDFNVTVEDGGGTVDYTDKEVDLDSTGTNTFQNTSSTDAINVSVDTSDSVTAGDSITITPVGSSDEIVEWEVELIWNPADQDSSIIYSDSS